MRIGIIGVGVTGGTLKRWIEEHTDHVVISYDPPKGINEDISESDIVFICVPVPTLSDGTQDRRILTDSIKKCPAVPIFIRSTVLPDFFQSHIVVGGEKEIFHVPEFLTERRAYEDLKTQGIVCSHDAVGILIEVFPGKTFYPQASEYDCALVKYAHNCFAAVKINFFNQIFKMAKSYENVREGFLSTGYINPEHTLVPGPDGRFGYGGNCFLKDTMAFAKWSKIKSVQASTNENNNTRRFVIKESFECKPGA